jgi:hypothetical protein
MATLNLTEKRTPHRTTFARDFLGMVLIMGVSIIIFGFISLINELSPLPDTEQYQYINQVKAFVDYEVTGQVLEEKYDNGDGVFAPSYFEVKIQGNLDTFWN